jgi:hypothetical protein
MVELGRDRNRGNWHSEDGYPFFTFCSSFFHWVCRRGAVSSSPGASALAVLFFSGSVRGEDIMSLAVLVRSSFAAVTVVAAFCTEWSAVVAQERDSPRQVRSDDLVIVTTIAEGVERSKTFRSLVDAIDATDGLVYVQFGECGHGVLACLHLSVVESGPYRLLRILVSPRITPRCELTASIGHELQHALEALGNPSIRSGRDMFAHFYQTSRTASGLFETAAALNMGARVAKEMCASRRRPFGLSSASA